MKIRTGTRRFLSLLMALVMVLSLLPALALAEDGGSATWSKVDLENIQPTDTVAITMTTSDGITYVLHNGNAASTAPTAVVGTVSANTLTTVDSDSLSWNIASTDDGYVIYKAGTTETWLYSTNANNGVRVGTNEAKVWVLDETSGYLKHVGTSRYLGVYTTKPDWRAYTNTTGNTKDQTLGFWKLDGNVAQRVATPVISPESGTVSETNLNVTITCATENATIYYTTNGDAPDKNSTQYDAGISITVGETPTVIKAIAVKENMTDSAVATATYTYSSVDIIPDPITDDMIGDGVLTVKQANEAAATGVTVIGQVVYHYGNPYNGAASINSIILEDVIDGEIYGF